VANKFLVYDLEGMNADVDACYKYGVGLRGTAMGSMRSMHRGLEVGVVNLVARAFVLFIGVRHHRGET
jgi:hypothetical protein